MVNYTPTTVNTIEFVSKYSIQGIPYQNSGQVFRKMCNLCKSKVCIILGFVFLCTCVLLVIENIVRSLIFLTEYIFLLKYLQEKNNIFFCLLILDISRCTTAKQKKYYCQKIPFRHMTKNGLCYQSISKTRFFENSLGIPENSICIQTMYFVLKKQFFDNA